MVLLGNKKQAKRFNGKRVGQAQNANGMMMNGVNGNGMMMNRNGLYTNGMVQGEIDVTNPSGDVMRNVSIFDAYQLNENQSLNAIEEETSLDIDVAVDDNNDRVVVITDDLSGAQVMANMPAPQQQAVQEDVCEFPAQSVELVRDVLITNTTPEIVDVQTDVCGNVISYTESMTRNMNATQWRATNPAQLAGPVRAFTQNQNGTYINGSGNVRLANSPGLNGFSVQPQVQPGPLVGRKRVHNSNQNASFGRSKMMSWNGN